MDIPEYSLNNILKNSWEEGFEITVSDSHNAVTISANKAGLLSLAKQLLTLAQEDVPLGCHYHLDDCNSLELGSKELIIQKV